MRNWRVVALWIGGLILLANIRVGLSAYQHRNDPRQPDCSFEEYW